MMGGDAELKWRRKGDTQAEQGMTAGKPASLEHRGQGLSSSQGVVALSGPRSMIGWAPEVSSPLAPWLKRTLHQEFHYVSDLSGSDVGSFWVCL